MDSVKRNAVLIVLQVRNTSLGAGMDKMLFQDWEFRVRITY